MSNSKATVGLIDGVGRFVLPLLSQLSPNRYDLIGSASIFTVADRYFLITAAHVARALKGTITAIGTPEGYMLVDLSLGHTSGEPNDRMDIALNEISPEIVERGKKFFDPFELACCLKSK